MNNALPQFWSLIEWKTNSLMLLKFVRIKPNDSEAYNRDWSKLRQKVTAGSIFNGCAAKLDQESLSGAKKCKYPSFMFFDIQIS